MVVTAASSLRELGEVELTAAEVKDVFLLGEVLGEVGGEVVETLLAVFLLLDEPCLAEDAEVLGDVVLSEVEALGDLVHAALLFHQHADDAQPTLFAEGLHRGDAVEFFHRLFIEQDAGTIKHGSSRLKWEAGAASGLGARAMIGYMREQANKNLRSPGPLCICRNKHI